MTFWRASAGERGPEIAGTRITVYDIMDYLKMNWHHTAIAAWLRISSYQVLAAIDYINAHREEVDCAAGRPAGVGALGIASGMSGILVSMVLVVFV